MAEQSVEALDIKLTPAPAGRTPSQLEWLTSWGDAPYYILLITLVAAVFAKTIFLGQPISHFFLIAEWDAMFAQFRTGFSLSTEASTVLHFVPTYMYIAQQLHAGHLPLWNALNAFGTPLIGDVQSGFLSPFRLLFDLWPNLYFYNLELAALPGICCTATFALARALGLNRAGAMLAAISYGLCPYFLWHMELWGAAYALAPLVCWLFRRAAKRNTIFGALVAGIAAGILVMSSHPEQAFFAISGASLLMLCSTSFGSFVRLLLIAGFSALCVSAPVFFPFVEFLKNSDCYKFGQGGMWPIPWQALLYNLAAPGFGAASSFMGFLILPLAVFAFGKKTIRRALPIMALWIVFLFITAELWPLSMWCYVPPLSLVITLYAGPTFLLASALLAGLGLESVVRSVSEGHASIRSAAIASSLTLLICLAPWILKLSHISLSSATFDLMLPPMAFSSGAFRLCLALCAVAVAGFFLAARKTASAGFLSALLLVLSFASMYPWISEALPARAPFAVPSLAAMDWLAQKKDRIVACGAGVAKPAANLLYGVDEVNIINPMSPKRYLSFIAACGGSMPDATFTVFGNRLSKTIDLAAVRYVLSQGAVSCTEDEKPAGTPADEPSLHLPYGITLKDLRLWTDAINHQAGGSFGLTLDNQRSQHRKCFLEISILNSNGKKLSQTELEPIEKLSSQSAYEFALPIPEKIDPRNCRIAVNLFDMAIAGYVLDKPMTVGNLPAPVSASSHSHFTFLREFPGGVRVYENSNALPRAYLVPEALVVSSEKEALKHVSSMDFDPRRTVILEQQPAVAAMGVRPAFTPVSVDRADPCTIKAAYRTNAGGYLVLTDSFFPGWKAFIDGQETPILHANYMFRAIAAPAGNHQVEFKYQPVTFASGCMLCIAFWLAFGIAVFRRMRHV